MLKTFESIKQHVRFNPSKPTIDNLVFKLHYRATFLLLIMATILVSSREYIGEHIRCLVDSGIPTHVIETFCFFTTTFTIASHYNNTLLEKEILPHPGVGPMSDNDKVTHHAYYQWVPFVLFGQAIAFYIPHLIWRIKENKRIARLIDGLQMAGLALEEAPLTYGDKTVLSKSDLQKKIGLIKQDFMLRLYATRPWSTWLVLCELLNFLNLVMQIFFTNLFLGGQFLHMGPQLFGVNWEGMVDPLDLVFPKVTKCQFYKYGPSGSIQKHDALCVMALNVINEKIFAFLWFWYLMLFIVTAFALMWRAFTFIMHSKSARFNEILFYNACPGRLNPWNVLTVTRHCQFADWLFLYYLAKNMDGFVFRNLFVELATEMETINTSPLVNFSSGNATPVPDEHQMDTLKLEQEPLTAEEKAA